MCLNALVCVQGSVEQLDRCIKDRAELEAAIAKECEREEASMQVSAEQPCAHACGTYIPISVVGIYLIRS